MMVASSSRAMSRTHGGRFAPKAGEAIATTTTTTTPSRSSRAQRASNTLSNQADIRDFVERRPAKRLKLSPPNHEPQTQPNTVQTSPKPPTKVLGVQPHGRLIQTLNGVQKALGINADEISSRDTTPGAASRLDGPSGPRSASNDKRSLRSQGGAGRLKSDLAIYFPNYEDVINDAPKTQGKFIWL